MLTCQICHDTDCACDDFMSADEEADDFLGPMDNHASEAVLKAAGITKRKWGCNNPDCCCSTGICDSMTFGSGKLDDYGYWEHPCWECARAWEKNHPGETCWPFGEIEREPRQERYMF